MDGTRARSKILTPILVVAVLGFLALYAVMTGERASTSVTPARTSGPDAGDSPAEFGASSPARRAEAHPEATGDGALEPSGGILLLDWSTRRPIAGEPWTLEREPLDATDPAPTRSMTTRSDGRIPLAPGSWRLDSESGRYKVLDPVVAVTSGAFKVAIAQRIGRLEFLLVDRMGSPISGVHCLWIPRIAGGKVPPDESVTARGDVGQTTTGADGVAVFERLPCDGGIGVFTSPGYARESRHLVGPLSSPLRVVLLHSEGEERTLRVHSLVDERPVTGARILDSRGVLLAEAAGDSNVVVLPAWLSRDEQLTVTSPTTCTGVTRTRQLSDERILAHPICTALVQYHDSGGGSAAAMLSIEDRTVQRTVDALLPVLPGPRLIRPGEGVVLELPQGVPLRFQAVAASGALASREELLSSESATVALAIRPSLASLTLLVTGEDGRPLPDAWALVRSTSGERTRLEASTAGRILVPLEAARKWIEVLAPGHAGAGLRYDGRVDAPPPGPETLTVVLDRALDVPIHLMDEVERPLSGLCVTIWRHRPEDFRPEVLDRLGAASNGWTLQNATAIAGITDGDGVFVARGMRPGLVNIEVGMPAEMMVSGMGVSLYQRRAEGVEVRDVSPKIVVIDAPRRMAFEVAEQETGLPVSHFELRHEERGWVESVRGSFWQGYLPSSVRSLGILVPGLGSRTVDPSDFDPHSVARIEISSARACELELVGLPPGTSPQPIELGFWNRTDAGYEHITQTSSTVVDGKASFTIPPGDDLVVGVIDFAAAGRTWTSRPPHQPCIPGGRVRFDVEQRE